MRLDRYVSHAAKVSRKQARELIRGGRVVADGVVVRDVSYHADDSADIRYDGAPLLPPARCYLMLHKPAGLVSATRDASQPTVLSCLPAALAARVHLVGRLDKDTTGLLLLTDDGAWSHAISAPRAHCAKAYVARLAAPLVADAEQRLAHGLLLRGETRPTRPATLVRLADDRVRIVVSEGRYHQVRRMFAALGNRVTALHREAIGALALDPALAPGEWRPLSDAERMALP